MPTFAFRFVGPDQSFDTSEPADFATVEEAREELVRGGRELIADALTHDEQIGLAAIEIVDADGRCLETVRLADLLPTIPSDESLGDCP
ncbi:DUF6894 family protein [Prosthecomicrobium sp. N25]|uniref:DUF6894 family protein n=1 Tax=Prosthecomicrobium sp. N25 TaxID=3129254 RepID=UPI003076B8A1